MAGCAFTRDCGWWWGGWWWWGGSCSGWSELLFLHITGNRRAMGNRSAGLRSDASGGKCVSRRMSSSVTYYYSPGAEAGGPPGHGEGGSPPLRSDSGLLWADSASDSRPLLVFFSWFGAQPGPVAKYRDVYLARGMDVLWVRSSVTHFLWPRWGLDSSRKVLDLLEAPPFSQRPLLVHASSIGGYTFAQILLHVAHGEERHRGLARRVKGQIYDSLVVGSLEYMAEGLGATLLPGLRLVVRRLAMFYFWLFKRHTADLYDRLVQVFRRSPVTAPALFFYSEDDALCHTAAMEDVMASWRERGVAVHSRKWEESVHAAHLRRHPGDYLAALRRFLDTLAADI